MGIVNTGSRPEESDMAKGKSMKKEAKKPKQPKQPKPKQQKGSSA